MATSHQAQQGRIPVSFSGRAAPFKEQHGGVRDHLHPDCHALHLLHAEAAGACTVDPLHNSSLPPPLFKSHSSQPKPPCPPMTPKILWKMADPWTGVGGREPKESQSSQIIQSVTLGSGVGVHCQASKSIGTNQGVVPFWPEHRFTK